MNSQERLLISQLFERLRSAANAPRDPEADSFIRQQTAAQPHAAYAMAQTIIVQNQALEAAQQRIAELESQLRGDARYGDDRNRGASFGGDRFGGSDRYGEERPMGAPDLGRGSVPPSGPWQHQQQAPSGPWQGQPQQQPQPSRGGGFLSGALQTAAGVAGGVLLGNAIGGMFGGGSSAKASENNAAADDKGNDDSDVRDASDNDSDGEGGWFSDLFGGGDDSGGGGGGGDDGDWS